MSFSWLGGRHEDKAQSPPLVHTGETPDELEGLRSQLQELHRRLAACEETDGRLDGIFELFNQSMTEVQLEVGKLRQELREERDARKALEKLVESQRPVAAEEWEIPDVPAPPPEAAQWSKSAERVLLKLAELTQAAPPALKANLEPTLAEATELARSLKGALRKDVELTVPLSRKSPVLKKLREQVKEVIDTQALSPEALERLHLRLVKVLVPEFVEVLEAGRRSGDPNLPFFRELEERLSALLEAAELEEIRPAPGTMYRPAEQNLLKAVRSDEQNLRDQVERCVNRGFRYRGELVKKAEVTVFL